MKFCAKKFAGVISAIALAAGLLAGCQQQPDPIIDVTEVVLNEKTLKLSVGDTKDLAITVTPENGDKTALTWKSDKEEIVTVKDGKVTAVKVGTAKVTVTTKDEKSTATCTITVVPEITGLKIAETLSLMEGAEKDLTVTVTPTASAGVSLNWESDKKDVATVENGKVTAVKEGTAKITVKTSDGKVSATCTVTVKAAPVITSLKLDATTATITAGETKTLKVTVGPTEAKDSPVIWESSDTKVATVDKGKITAVKEGTAKITVKSKDGKVSATCEVTVKAAPVITSLTLDATTAKLNIGDTKTLKVTIGPDEAKNLPVVWESSNKEVATVANGKVTAVKEGTATITVKSKDGKVSAKCEVTVIKETTISFEFPSIKMAVGEERDLQVKFSSEPDEKTVTWKSDSSNVSVDANGHVKVENYIGWSVTITATWGKKTAKCDIKVLKERTDLEKIEPASETLTCEVEGGVNFKTKLTPTYPDYDALKYSIEDESIATISSYGYIAGVKEGKTKATVTYYVMPGVEKTFTQEVTVTKKTTKIESLSFNFDTITLVEGSTFKLEPVINPANAENKELMYESDKPAIATVDENGIITAVKASTSTWLTSAKITVKPKAGNAKPVYVYVEVLTPAKAAENKITSMELNKEKSNFDTPIPVGGSRTVFLKTNFSDEDYKLYEKLNWTSTDPEVAAWSSNSTGIQAGAKAGKVTITATTIDGSLKLSFDVTVEATKSIKTEKAKYQIAKGKSLVINPIVDPAGGYITATSSNTSVATVTNTLTEHSVKGVKPGTATITYTSKDGVKCSCEVTVFDVPDYYLDESDLSVLDSQYYDEMIFDEVEYGLVIGFDEWDSTKKQWIGHDSLKDPIVKALDPGTYSKEKLFEIGDVISHTSSPSSKYKVYKMTCGDSNKNTWVCNLYIIKESDWKE